MNDGWMMTAMGLADGNLDRLVSGAKSTLASQPTRLCQVRPQRATATTSPRSVPGNVIAPRGASIALFTTTSHAPLLFFSPSPSPILITNNKLTLPPTPTPTNPINTSQWPPFLVSRSCVQCCAREMTASFLFVVIYRNSITTHLESITATPFIETPLTYSACRPPSR
jgi:hypothetical protein